MTSNVLQTASSEMQITHTGVLQTAPAVLYPVESIGEDRERPYNVSVAVRNIKVGPGRVHVDLALRHPQLDEQITGAAVLTYIGSDDTFGLRYRWGEDEWQALGELEIEGVGITIPALQLEIKRRIRARIGVGGLDEDDERLVRD